MMKIKTLSILIVIFAASFAASAQAKIYLAGDSTCAKKLESRRPETGWGEMLQQYFDPAKAVVDDRALNGRSTRTFITEGHWQEIVDALKKGDWVFVQFGHNDESKEKTDRYTPPADYRANLLRFLSDVRSKKANIVLMTPVARRTFDKAGKAISTHPLEYTDAVREIARSEKVPFIDMEKKSLAVLDRYGPDASRELFLQLKPGENANYPNGITDNTHFRPKGAEEMAKLAVEGIRETHIKLRKSLKK